MTDHATLAAALVAALADLTVVEKGRTVDFTTDSGKRVHYDYADLPSVITLTRPVLAEHGVVALTPVHAHGNGLRRPDARCPRRRGLRGPRRRL